MQRLQRSLKCLSSCCILRGDATHPACRSCSHVVDEIQSTHLRRSVNIADHADRSNCGGAGQHSLHRHIIDKRRPPFHAACSHPETAHQNNGFQGSHASVIKQFDPAEQLIPATLCLSGTAQTQRWLAHTAWNSSQQCAAWSRHAVLSAPASANMGSTFMRSCHAAATQEDAEQPVENCPSPADNFHEMLTFDADGFAVSQALHRSVVRGARQEGGKPSVTGDVSAAVAPEAFGEMLLDSISGMLCILQLLPADSSSWIAEYLGFHSIEAMLQLRRDLESHGVASVVANATRYCKAGSAAASQLSGSHQSDSVKKPAQLQEILLDDGLPSLLRLTDGNEVELPRAVMCVYVLANMNRLNEMLRTHSDMVAWDGVLTSMDGTGDAVDSAGMLSAGEMLLESPGNEERELRKLRSLFTHRRRAGISRTLHRVSCIEDASGVITGLTLRIGRHVPAAAWPLTDVLAMIHRENRWTKYSRDMSSDDGQAQGGLPCSVLILGGPASGKTTILRDVSQQLSVRFGLGRRVIIVDSSSEIGGQGQVPHPAVGTSRRFVVPQGVQQSNVLMQALANHNPDVIIVDELSGHGDIEAARSVCHRGVNLVATAHSTSLQYLLSNPQMNPLLGGLHEVILGAQEVKDIEKRRVPSVGYKSQKHAFARMGGSRTRTERRQPPCFQVIVEILGSSAWRIHWNAAESIDALLCGEKPPSELRMLRDGQLYSRDESSEAESY